MSDETDRKLSKLIDDASFVDRLGYSIPGLVYVFDLEERKNVYANRALTEHLGYSVERVRAFGSSLIETLVHPEDLQRALAHHRSMAEVPDGEIIEVEYRMRAASGEWRWLHSWETVLSRDANGNARHLFGIAQDVTSRVVTELALRESERRLAESEQRWRSIVENPFDFVVVIDRSYKYTFVNFVAPGLKMEDLLGKATPFEFVAPECHAVMKNALEEAFERGIPTSYEVFVPIVGKWYTSLVGPIREGDVVTQASILTREITEQKKLEVQARRAEQRLRLAIEGAEEVLFDRDLETGEAFVAPRLYGLLGYSQTDTVIDVFGASFAEWLHPDDRALVLEAHESTLKSGAPFSQEFRLRTSAGDFLWFAARGRVVRESGEHDHFAGFLTDSTERKEREAELGRQHHALKQALDEQHRLEARLGQAAKLEAVGRLAGGIAHDFNNLLTGVSGVAEVLAADMKPGDPNSSEVADLQQAVDRGAALTRQLLAFSRQQVIAPRLIDLNVLLADTARLLCRLIGEHIELSLRPVPDLWAVSGDPNQIEQVLVNLAVNSRDAMPTGGRLLIELSNVVLDDTYVRQQPDAQSGSFVRLVVSDTGAGMDAETLARIFEPFFTTKPIGMGTGLGLATAYGVVRQAGGFIHVYSEPGHGTSFKIYLPRAIGTAPLPAPPERSRPRGTETILVVEDEELVLRLARRVLESLGYRVEVAMRGDDALAMIEAGVAFDLLLTDVMLPGFDGHELYQRGVALRPGLKSVFMSGYTDNLIVDRGILESDAHFLQKPFTTDELATKVRAALDRTTVT